MTSPEVQRILEAGREVWGRTQLLKAQLDQFSLTMDGVITAQAELAIALRPLLTIDSPPSSDWQDNVGVRVVDLQNDMNGYTHLEVCTDEVLTRTRFHNLGWVGMHHAKEAGPLDNFVCEDVHLDNALKWLSRAYRMRGLPGKPIVQRHCTLSNTQQEHGYYWNLAGGGANWGKWVDSRRPAEDQIAILIEGCYFTHLASQAIQFVYRPQEQGFDFEALGDGALGGVIVVEYCIFEDIGWNHTGNARASYALSFFPTPHPVFIDHIVVDNSLPNLAAQASATDADKGCLLIQKREKAVVLNSTFLMNVTDRPIGQFSDLDELVIQGCHWQADGGQVEITVDNCTNVVIEGCTGNVRIVVDGVDVGPIEEGYMS